MRTGVPIYAVVKGDAYGHGASQIVRTLVGKVDGFAVSILEEGLSVLAAGGKSVLVFTPPTDEKEGWLIVKNGLTATVGSLVTAKLILDVCDKSRLTAKVHIKCNTGMNRYGVEFDSLESVCKMLKTSDRVCVEGVYSHLYAHDEKTSQEQRIRFCEAQTVCKRYFPQARAHLSATYGALLGEKFSFDAVRLGLGLYGYLPDDVDERLMPLKKVMTLYGKCTDERIYRYGGAGYSHNAPKRGEKMYTLRCGYADGLSYRYGDCFPLERLSSPCMDACVCRGEGALVGQWLPIMTDARRMALEEKTISYEILCRASARAERVYGYD